MLEVEKRFYELCKQYNDQQNNDYKGFLLYKAFKNQKFDEELLSSYVIAKPKFDAIYSVLITKTRIIEINTYSTMYIVSTRKFKEINKVIIEQEFDDKKTKELLKDEALPERVQLRVQYIDAKNDVEELVWESIESKENISQILEFSDKIREIQANPSGME